MKRHDKINKIQMNPLRVVLTMAVVLLLAGCARKRDLEQVSREQAATIQSLNSEIARLNAELDNMMRSRADLLSAKEELERQLQKELQSGDMSVSMQERGLVVTLLSRVLFDSGKVEVKDSAKETLATVAKILAEKLGENLIFIEGHTDNEPIRYSGWRSNWELSTGRATEVIHYFIDAQGVNPERLAAVGYGEYQPVDSNDTEEGRLQNRRVEIVISPKKLVVPGAAPAGA